jgi:hypothetical protein
MLYAPLTSTMLATCPAHLILLALITLKHWAKSTNHAAPYYAAFFYLLSLHPS